MYQQVLKPFVQSVAIEVDKFQSKWFSYLCNYLLQQMRPCLAISFRPPHYASSISKSYSHAVFKRRRQGCNHRLFHSESVLWLSRNNSEHRPLDRYRSPLNTDNVTERRQSRSGIKWSYRYPILVDPATAISVGRAILDGGVNAVWCER